MEEADLRDRVIVMTSSLKIKRICNTTFKTRLIENPISITARKIKINLNEVEKVAKGE